VEGARSFFDYIPNPALLQFLFFKFSFCPVLLIQNFLEIFFLAPFILIPSLSWFSIDESCHVGMLASPRGVTLDHEFEKRFCAQIMTPALQQA
jgi:hypothetical protein